jgi:hypothetical protein
VGNREITLGNFEKMLKGLLEMATAQERWDTRHSPVMFRIESDTLRVVVEGKKRPLKYVVTEMKIEDNSLTVVIAREFEELEDFNGNRFGT